MIIGFANYILSVVSGIRKQFIHIILTPSTLSHCFVQLNATITTKQDGFLKKNREKYREIQLIQKNIKVLFQEKQERPEIFCKYLRGALQCHMNHFKLLIVSEEESATLNGAGQQIKVRVSFIWSDTKYYSLFLQQE